MTIEAAAAVVIAGHIPYLVTCPGANWCPTCEQTGGPCDIDLAAAGELLVALAEAGIVLAHAGVAG